MDTLSALKGTLTCTHNLEIMLMKKDDYHGEKCTDLFENLNINKPINSINSLRNRRKCDI